MKISPLLPFRASTTKIYTEEKLSNKNVNDYVSSKQAIEPNQLNWLSYINFGKKSKFDEILKNAETPLEKRYFNEVIRSSEKEMDNWLNVDLSNENEFTVTLTSDMLEDPKVNPNGLGLKKWFENYKKEAAISTAGIRGNQNILFPNDSRQPLNLVGMMIATEAKARVKEAQAKEEGSNTGRKNEKIAAGEVRYNTNKYIDLISRIQAAHGITTHITEPDTTKPTKDNVPERQTIPIWMASFLIFKKGFSGGEYVTSSHSPCRKIATKDLNEQGSQYLPDESAKFVNEMENIINEIGKGEYKITIAARDNKFIDTDLMKEMDNGVDLYVDYLKSGVATDKNLELIKQTKKPIYIDCVGGCAYNTLSKVFDKLDVGNHYGWFHKKETPFFHDIGKKIEKDQNAPTYKMKVTDKSVDAALIERTKSGKALYPVIETMGYEKLLADKPVGTVVFITDPDHDRLCVAQLEENTPKNREKLKKIGIDFYEFKKEDKNKKNDTILAVYSPNQSFLMAMDFHKKQLETWNKHPRFIIKTTASAKAWDEWAEHNGVKVVNTPVGFKELANVMKKVENQIVKNPNKDVIITDVFGKDINLGKDPRLVFAGEESGGMIVGPEELISSDDGKKAIAMREKSATEAIMLTSALVADLEKKNTKLSEHLENIFNENKIIEKFDVRKDVTYYDETIADPAELAKAKEAGEKIRTENDLFYRSMAMKMYDAKQELSVAQKKVDATLEATKGILNDVFNTPKYGNLSFDDLQDIDFVGDGTYLKFPNKYVEIRPSGTDAKTKGYSSGTNKKECIAFADKLADYREGRTELFNKFISPDYCNNVEAKSKKLLENWQVKE